MGAYCTKQPTLMQCHAIAIGILDLRFTIFRFTIAFGHSGICRSDDALVVVRCTGRFAIHCDRACGLRLIRWRGRHRHESTPVATTPSSSCVARGGSRLSRPLLAAHYHLSTTTYIFYTSTRPFFTMARAPSPRKHPRSDDALVVVRCTGRVALVATVTRRPPPSTHYHLHLLHSNAFSDEVDPAWTYLVLTDGEHSVYAPAHSRPS